MTDQVAVGGGVHRPRPIEWVGMVQQDFGKTFQDLRALIQSFPVNMAPDII